MQTTELNFIIRAKEGNQYRTLITFPCGLRQHNYNSAYKQALDNLKALEQHGVKCRLITAYKPLYKSNNTNQLHIIGV